MELTPEERDKYLARLIREKCDGKGHARTWAAADLALRNEALYYEMGLGKSYSQIRRELSVRWGCADVTIQKYLRIARAELTKINEEKKEEFRQKMIEKLERLATDALAHNDRKSALAAYDQISKLQGAYTQKIEADVKSDIQFEFGE